MRKEEILNVIPTEQWITSQQICDLLFDQNKFSLRVQLNEYVKIGLIEKRVFTGEKKIQSGKGNKNPRFEYRKHLTKQPVI